MNRDLDMFPHNQIQVKHFHKDMQWVICVPLSLIPQLTWSLPDIHQWDMFLFVISKLSVGVKP